MPSAAYPPSRGGAAPGRPASSAPSATSASHDVRDVGLEAFGSHADARVVVWHPERLRLVQPRCEQPLERRLVLDQLDEAVGSQPTGEELLVLVDVLTQARVT